MDQNKHRIFLTVKDHSVSKQTFGLHHDLKLDLLITFPKPTLKELPAYYESEDYISHTDGTRSLFEKVYQYIRRIALKNKINLINQMHPDKGAILDIGAGTGDFLSIAKQENWQVTGIEPNQKAKAIASKKGVSFEGSTKNLKNHSFDVITMWHVLEHVPDLEFQLKELKRLLKPNGTIIIAVPNFNSYDAKYYKSFWAAYDVPRHLWHFSKTAIKKLFYDKGMVLKNILPMKFDAFYVALLSEKYKRGYMNFLMAFMVGMKSNRKAKQNLEYSSHIYIIKNQ
ncbi:MAG TPA: class I SAM-dependent methyltransferase [Flavobacterium sp.]|jgi:2-polyprenyl-3-methyl-5-hydroxy-6-metoxy-1,4-benzoquinol methylase